MSLPPEVGMPLPPETVCHCFPKLCSPRISVKNKFPALRFKKQKKGKCILNRRAGGISYHFQKRRNQFVNLFLNAATTMKSVRIDTSQCLKLGIMSAYNSKLISGIDICSSEYPGEFSTLSIQCLRFST